MYQFPRVTYGNFSCYYSLYGFVVRTQWVTTEPIVVSNPVSVEYTINAYICTVYCITQNSDRGNFDVFDVFELDRQNLTHQIVLKQYSVYRYMVKGSNHPSKYVPSNIWRVSICQNFPHQNLLYTVVKNFSSKILLW